MGKESMKWLDKLRVFKRLRNQEALIKKLDKDLERASDPVFFYEYEGSKRGLRPWQGGMPDFKNITLMGKLKFAEKMAVEKRMLDDLLLILITDQGVFRKMLGDGDREVWLTEKTLNAKCWFPIIWVGQKVVILDAMITWRGVKMADVTYLRDMWLEPGDELNVHYTFNAYET